MPVNTSYSVSSFQQCDGTNFTTAGVDNSYKVGSGSIGAYAGIGLTFDGKSSSAIVDLKGSVPYGDSPVSGGFRIRNNLNENAQSVQFRVQPCTVTVPVSNKTSIYTTPYVVAKVNYDSGKVNTNIGNYTGVSTNMKIAGHDVKGFVEVQAYDLTNIKSETTSVNVGFSISI